MNDGMLEPDRSSQDGRSLDPVQPYGKSAGCCWRDTLGDRGDLKSGDARRDRQRAAENEVPVQCAIAGASQLAGAGGIEPPNGGIKIRCLTAWLRPNWSSGNARRPGYRGFPRMQPVYRENSGISTVCVGRS